MASHLGEWTAPRENIVFRLAFYVTTMYNILCNNNLCPMMIFDSKCLKALLKKHLLMQNSSFLRSSSIHPKWHKIFKSYSTHATSDSPAVSRRQEDVLSDRHFVKQTFCLTDILSDRHFVRQERPSEVHRRYYNVMESKGRHQNKTSSKSWRMR